MKFTIGVITTNPKSQMQVIFDSLSLTFAGYNDEFEVIIVGGDYANKHENLTLIPFDETKKPAWITRKKNIITENAKFDNIVYMHDYIVFNENWYNGFLKFGDNFDVCMTPIQNADGSRFRDWTLWPHDTTPDGSANLNALLPYDVTDLSRYMYISGAYWIAKKHVMKEFPLDESLSWGESEDVKWSKQVREKYQFKINPYSSVKLLKLKDPVFSPATYEVIQELRAKK